MPKKVEQTLARKSGSLRENQWPQPLVVEIKRAILVDHPLKREKVDGVQLANGLDVAKWWQKISCWVFGWTNENLQWREINPSLRCTEYWSSTPRYPVWIRQDPKRIEGLHVFQIVSLRSRVRHKHRICRWHPTKYSKIGSKSRWAWRLDHRTKVQVVSWRHRRDEATHLFFGAWRKLLEWEDRGFGLIEAQLQGLVLSQWYAPVLLEYYEGERKGHWAASCSDQEARRTKDYECAKPVVVWKAPTRISPSWSLVYVCSNSSASWAFPTA